MRTDVEHLRTSTSIGDILIQIQKEIKICGNSIDTYYKERRLCKRPTFISDLLIASSSEKCSEFLEIC